MLLRNKFLGCLLALTLLSSCGRPDFSCDSAEGRGAIVAEVDQLLSSQDCTSALALIEAYYVLPGCAADEIRQARAAANACAANINFFQLVSDLATNNIVGNELWVTLTLLFPSSLTDQRLTGGQNAMDALFAIRRPGTLTPPEYLINSTSANPGTLVAGHRTEDSNTYSMLVSMALIGSLQNRYGAPLANYHRGQKLGTSASFPNGWETVGAVDVNACTYAGAILTLFDSIEQIGPTLAASFGSTGATLVASATAFTALLSTACDAGCVTCGFAAGSCTTCPIELRDRFSCTGIATDKASCSAAGIAQFMNSTPAGFGWPN